MEEGLDIDWFALDEQDNVLHFASGGGKVPTTVTDAVTDNEYLRSFLIRLPKLSDETELSRDLNKFVTFKSDESKNVYVRDFLFMASIGLFSFDKSFLGQPSDSRYHLVCLPNRRLLLKTLPLEIQNILKRTRIKFNAEESTSVDISTII